MKRIAVATVAVVLLMSWWMYGQASIQVGYVVVNGTGAGRLPVGTALFSYTNPAGVLVSEAAVGSSEPIRSGRIYVNELDTRTGFAMANSSSQAATATLILRNTSGIEVGRQSLSLPAQQHLSRYVSELFPNRPANFIGSLTFESDQPLAAITLRESRNAFDEPLYTTLPVLDLSSGAGNQPLVFPHIAAGDGYTTQLVLINATGAVIRGAVRLFGSNGLPLQLRLAGADVTQFSYQIDPNGTTTFVLDSLIGLKVGYAQVVPDPGNASPGGSAIFQFRSNGFMVTEAGVASIGTTASRIFVDQTGTQTGVAIANPSALPVDATLILMDRNGFVEATTTQTLPAQGHLSKFVNELFPTVGEGFTGLMEIRSATPLVPITLKVTINARGTLVLTTLPVADLTRISTATSYVFAHAVIGGEYATRLIFLNPEPATVSAGNMTFFKSDGTRMSLPLEGVSGSQFNYQLTAGGGRQFFPGNTNPLAELTLLAAGSGQSTTEVAVNEGNSVRAKLRARDSTGRVRDDFDAAYASLDTSVATVDAAGNILGKKAGFSTLTISARGVVTNATITVVTVGAGLPGYDVTGIAQDLNRRVYLASAQEHTILVTANLAQAPSVYAGVAQRAGLKNDLRLQSEFRGPSFLTIGQADGNLFVSDGANHVIRRIQPGTNGRVATIAGAGTAGGEDGALLSARFNNPKGIALDGRGNLWVADSGNHSIRRINLVTGLVDTVAGLSGSAGLADGKGALARFSSPAGIAVELEPLAQQQDRERKGLPPPPVSLIVADSGNGVLRRVKETGEVTTISLGSAVSAVSDASGSKGTGQAFGAAIAFNSPTGVAIDPFGNIYVTDSASGQVKTVLRSGDVVDAAQPNTFQSPKGVVIAESSRILVADRTGPARQIQFGEPSVTSVTPNRIGAQGGVSITIKGSNFAPDSIVVVGNVLVPAGKPADTQTITFVAPALPSGRSTLTVQNRGGIAQTSVLIDAISLNSLSPGGITTFAGGTTFAGDGQSATTALLGSPLRIVFDSAGNQFIVDRDNYRIRRVSAATGVITTVAGNGIPGTGGDNGPATAASLDFPQSLALDAAGNLYIGETSRLRKVDAVTGVISTIAGTNALLNYPTDLTVDGAGNLFIADWENHRVRKIVLRTGIISTIAGTGQANYSGDGGPAAQAALNHPAAVTTDRAGNLFIADQRNYRVRRVDAVTGIITTLAGNGVSNDSGDGGPALSASFVYPQGLAMDTNGNLIVADAIAGRIRIVDMGTGLISALAGNGDFNFYGDGGLARNAALFLPRGVAVDGSGNVVIADTLNNRIRRVSSVTDVISTVVGSTDATSAGDQAEATFAVLNLPGGIVFDPAGNLLIADRNNERIRNVAAATRVITTVAGTGIVGSSGDEGPARNAGLFYPEGIALDRSGDFLIADSDNDRIRRVSAQTGFITTVAGSGTPGFFGDGGPATAARLYYPNGIAVDNAGNLYIADTGNHRIRKVDAVTGFISTLAGTGQQSYGGDNGPATAAALNNPWGIVVDGAGNVFFADRGNSRIRRIAAATGTITTVAGNGTTGFSGDNLLATATSLNFPLAIAFDAAGSLFISDSGNERIRRVSATTGIITTVAGTGTPGFSGDGGAATAAGLSRPDGLVFSSRGDLYVSDSSNSRVRVIRGPIP